MEAVKQVLFRTDEENSFATNVVTGALYLGLGAVLATQAGRIHKFAPLAIAGALCAAEMVDSMWEDHDYAGEFTSNWLNLLPSMSGFLVVGSALAAWQAFPVVKHAVQVGTYNASFAKELAIAAGPAVLSALTIGHVYRNCTYHALSRFENTLVTFGLYRLSKPDASI